MPGVQANNIPGVPILFPHPSPTQALNGLLAFFVSIDVGKPPYLIVSSQQADVNPVT
jgi:hypothetical protein